MNDLTKMIDYHLGLMNDKLKIFGNNLAQIKGKIDIHLIQLLKVSTNLY